MQEKMSVNLQVEIFLKSSVYVEQEKLFLWEIYFWVWRK